MAWGRRVQDAIAAGIAADQGWKCRPMPEYIRLMDARMGASFDYEVECPVRGKGILEIKNVDFLVFRDKWTDDDQGMEAPPHIEIQLQHQLHLAELEWGAIGVLIGGNDARCLVRDRDQEVGASIESSVRAFWKSIAEGVEPPPVFPEDAEFVAKLHGYAEPGKLFDARGRADIAALLSEYKIAAEQEKLSGEDKKVARAKVLQIIGDAEKVMADGYNVSCGLVGPANIAAYTRAGYRGWRVTVKKESK
jgi:predicted phage-related endonuclease